MTDALDRFARDFRAGTVLFQEGQPPGGGFTVPGRDLMTDDLG